MKNLHLSTILLLLAVLFGTTVSSAQRAWRVSQLNNASADFTSLAAAITAASNGDTLYVESGSYGNISLDKNLVIYGVGIRPAQYVDASLSSIASSVATMTLFDGASGSRVSGLTVVTLTTSKVPPGFVLSNVTFSRCEFTSSIDFMNYSTQVASHLPIQLNNLFFNACLLPSPNLGNSNSSFLNGVIVSNCIINNPPSVAATTIGTNDNTGVIFLNNVIKGSNLSTHHAIFQNNIFTDPSFLVSGSHNVFSNNIWVASSVSTGTGQTNNQFNSANLFGNTLSAIFNGSVQGNVNLNDHTLKAGSPAIGAGLNGVDCGIFGGTQPAVIPPLPSIPSVYYLDVEANPSPASNQIGVRVKARAGN